MLTSNDIEEFYKELLSKFQEQPYGPFDAVVAILGEARAHAVCDGQCIARPRLTSQPATSQPTHSVNDDSDSDASIELEQSPRKRASLLL